jgi:hypothetical protein
MFLRKLFGSIRANRRSAQQHNDEQGALIARRLRELLDVTKPTQVEMPFTKVHIENAPSYAHLEKTGT